MSAPFAKILIANRGEIAVRIIRTAREMSIATVAVYSEADRDAIHVRMADEAYLIGPAAPSASYLNIDAILETARRAGAQAIHPGYGFLAENAAFARRIIAAGLTWIGPHPDAIDAMGDKLRARQAMAKAGVPFVPGGTEAIADVAGAREAALAYGLPLALKASGGGGGKGLKVARTLDEIESAFTTARREAESYFKNGTIYAERYLENPKHVELQILADKHGNVLHVGERDCSLQRRHQKLWEEAPAQIPLKVRRAMREAGVRAAQAIGYDSVGTIECLVKGDDFFFLEMNTRIQVEHTVTEMISGLDLIREQIRVAAGDELGFTEDEVTFHGAAIEGRVNAEDPADNFRPAPGTVTAYHEPGGLGVRVDSAAYPGYTISPDYDSMIAKLVVWAPTRAQAIARLARAIDEYAIEGVPTTLPLLRALCDEPSVRDASYGTATLESFAAKLFDGSSAGERNKTQRAGGGTIELALGYGGGAEPSPPQDLRVQVNDKLYRVRVFDLPQRGSLPTKNGAQRLAPRSTGKKQRGAASGNDVVSPMHGVVVEMKVCAGDSIAEGQVVAIVEAMKMMNEIRAHKSGTVSAVHAAAGATIESRAPLVTVE
ncbi:MAG TPA: acetyl-CoA carboxylase biotin carboxylase subunit [Candidatus Baltobacteraceae bacterium]|nr:acetyl-CoA carboxylase biotin carboxylase subunit [Candidatus Baltobacteraceae bacterium]